MSRFVSAILGCHACCLAFPACLSVCCECSGDGRQGKWEATGHIVKLQEASEEVTMELRDSSKLPTDTTTGAICAPDIAFNGVVLLDNGSSLHCEMVYGCPRANSRCYDSTRPARNKMNVTCTNTFAIDIAAVVVHCFLHVQQCNSVLKLTNLGESCCMQTCTPLWFL